MKLVTVFVPQGYLETIEDMVRKGKYPNRSATIRIAIRELIIKEMEAKE
jgi:Arc/MetJ-type ribon-helix-helix transcriptional regulator